MPFFETGGGAVRVIGKTSCPIIYPGPGAVVSGYDPMTGDAGVVQFTPNPPQYVLPQCFSRRGAWIYLPANALYPGSVARPYWAKPGNSDLEARIYGNAFPGISQWQVTDEPLADTVVGPAFAGGDGAYVDAQRSIINAPGLTVGPYDSIKIRASLECASLAPDANNYFSFSYNDTTPGASFYYLQIPGSSHTTLNVVGGLSAGGPNSSGLESIPQSFAISNGPGGFGGYGEADNFLLVQFDISQELLISYTLSKNPQDMVTLFDFVVTLEKAPYNI